VPPPHPQEAQQHKKELKVGQESTERTTQSLLTSTGNVGKRGYGADWSREAPTYHRYEWKYGAGDPCLSWMRPTAGKCSGPTPAEGGSVLHGGLPLSAGQ